MDKVNVMFDDKSTIMLHSPSLSYLVILCIVRWLSVNVFSAHPDSSG